jgi:hypothetical protein
MIPVKIRLSIHLIIISYLTILVVACSGPVVTEWIAIKDPTATAKGFITYAAPSTIRKSTIGPTVRMWSMIDSAVIQGAASDRPHFSWIDDWEYDCEGKRLRPLEFREYSGEMGTGENVYSQASPASLWMEINPGSVGEASWIMACGKE